MVVGLWTLLIVPKLLVSGGRVAVVSVHFYAYVDDTNISAMTKEPHIEVLPSRALWLSIIESNPCAIDCQRSFVLTIGAATYYTLHDNNAVHRAFRGRRHER